MSLFGIKGVHVPHRKHTADCHPERMPIPKTVVIPMAQHIGAPAKPVVNVGDTVGVGQVIGEATGFISAPVHASVSGTVKKIDTMANSNGGTMTAITIESDGEMRAHESVVPPTVTNYEEFVAAVRASGIVGLGGAGFPTFVKLSVKDLSQVQEVVLNGAECEPYITADYRLMMEHAEQIVSGARLIQKVLGIPNVVIGIEDNKMDAVEVMRKAASKFEGFRVDALKTVGDGCEMIALLIPSAMTVYPELVPEQYKQATGKTKLDLVSEALTAGGATVIDLRTAFSENKNDEMPLYFKLDSHWSDYGAFVAYTELFNHISKTFPEAKPHGIDEFNWRGDYYQSGDMAYYLGMSRFGIKEYSYYRTFNFPVPKAVTLVNRYTSEQSLTYSDDVTYERTVYTGIKSLPNAIVMRDSYSTQIYDLIAERMNQTHYLGMWNYTWDNSLINSEKPDYVIYILAEWNLDAVING